MPLCRFDDGLLAIVKIDTPKGCICYPDDKEQDLCLQHFIKDGMIGPVEIIEIYDSDLLKLYYET